jgi:voltage-gated sodium channel
MSRITEHVFERVVTLVIVANAVIAVWGLVDHVHEELLESLEQGCLLFFVGELLARVGRHRGAFFGRPWNVFDLVVIALAIIPLPLSASVLRVGRVARLVHLGRHVPSPSLMVRRLGCRW